MQRKQKTHRRGRRGGEEMPPPETTEMTTPMVIMPSSGGRRRKSHRRGKRGGDASDWVISNFGGSTEQQFMNTFGNDGNGNAGNLIPTLTGAPAVLPYNIPQGSLAQNAAPVQGGGRRKKKGGYWGQVLKQALVPFGLLGLQQLYGKRHTRKQRK